MVSYILITGYSILLFMNPLNVVAVILKVLLVNLLVALNFANVFLNIKNVWKIQKTLKNVKNVTKIENVKTSLHLWFITSRCCIKTANFVIMNYCNATQHYAMERG